MNFMKMFTITRGDFFGGITAGVVALPLALAFGVQSGLGAAAGLYGAIFLGFFAAAFGGTPSQISGPTGPMTVVSSATIAGFLIIAGSVDNAIGAIVACFVLAGIFQVLMGVLKIGTLIKYIPYPVISGFMSGIGVIIILLQIFPALGSNSPKTTIDVVRSIGGAVSAINYEALLFSSLTIAIIYIFPRLTRAVPGTLVALIIVTLLSVLMNAKVPVIGDIPQGFPALRLDGFADISPNMISAILTGAITLAALGSIDSLLTSVVADNITKTKHDSNRELVGQGIGNAVGGLFAGIPGAGATMRTLVNIRSGGRHRISGIIHALTLLAVLLGAGKYAALIPNSVLAGILITVGIGILDYKGLRHLTRVPRADAVIMILVLLATVFLDLLTAVGIGMVLGSVLFMKKMSDITEDRIQINDLSDKDLAGKKMPEGMQENVLVKRLDGPLFFGLAASFQEKMNALNDIRFVILRMERVPFIDQTGLYALEESIISLEKKGINVLLSGTQKQPEEMLRRIEIIPRQITEEHLFTSFSDCIQWLSKKEPGD
jgi:sulfate permease, SulP family